MQGSAHPEVAVPIGLGKPLYTEETRLIKGRVEDEGLEELNFVRLGREKREYTSLEVMWINGE